LAKRLFEIATPLGFVVRCSREYWEFLISQKHPVLSGRERDIEQVLANPEEIRHSRKDQNVYLFYRRSMNHWLCAVARREGEEGFLITAYPTDTMKVGTTVWTKSK